MNAQSPTAAKFVVPHVKPIQVGGITKDPPLLQVTVATVKWEDTTETIGELGFYASLVSILWRRVIS